MLNPRELTFYDGAYIGLSIGYAYSMVEYLHRHYHLDSDWAFLVALAIYLIVTRYVVWVWGKLILRTLPD